MTRFKRIHIIVLDSVGIGGASDAGVFGDDGADTLGNIARTVPISLPNLNKLGLGRLKSAPGLSSEKHTIGYTRVLSEISAGKDTLTGHWELMGLILQTPFPVYPDGFPQQLIDELERYSKRGIVCNLPYSGTGVLDDYGDHQLKTGDLILYTSTDSVLQIAAHKDVIPLEELYDICSYARRITLEDSFLVGRIIARPYIGSVGRFTRTPERHDYAVSPPEPTVLNQLREENYDVLAIGKINDIFNGSGITSSISVRNNMDGVDKLMLSMKKEFRGISFTNLVDFDMKFGHRRDTIGYASALEDFDARIPELLALLQQDDLLMITADHGNDPTYLGTDHTRERVPLLIYSPLLSAHGCLTRGNFADVGCTVAENFGLQGHGHGHGVSVLSDLI